MSRSRIVTVKIEVEGAKSDYAARQVVRGILPLGKVEVDGNRGTITAWRFVTTGGER